MRKSTCASIAGVSGLILCVVGVLVVVYFQDLVNYFINQQLILQEGAESFKLWAKPPVHPQTRFYFFNYTNREEVLQGEGLPKVEEVGPYVYEETWEKVDIQFHPNGTVSYRQRKLYRFMPDNSVGTEDDVIISPNAPMLSATSQLKFAAKLMRLALSSMFEVLKEEPFAPHTVRDLLWGYEDPLLKLGKDIMPPEQQIPYEKFGYYVGRNGTGEGVYTVFTGSGDITKYAAVDTFKGEEKLHFWNSEYCNTINGTDGSAFSPSVKRSTVLYLFNPDLCRSIPLVYSKTVKHNQVDGYRFVPPDNVFDDVDSNPDNMCYCLTGPPCPRSGVFNISACQYGSPVLLSWPHFYNADASFLKGVIGLRPNKWDHQFYMDVQPKLGIAMQAWARIQINIQFNKIENIKPIANMSMDGTVLPVLWFESGIEELTPEVYELFKQATEQPIVAEAAMTYTFFLIGGILLVLVIVFFVCKKTTCFGKRKIGDKDLYSVPKPSTDMMEKNGVTPSRTSTMKVDDVTPNRSSSVPV